MVAIQNDWSGFMYKLIKITKYGLTRTYDFNTKKLAIYYAYFLLSLRHVAKIKLYHNDKLLLSMAVNDSLKGNISYFVRQFNSLE